MPANLTEFHRFLCLGETISARKAILGSFSVAHLTKYSDGTKYHSEKEFGLDFFYGSSRNRFWQWYKRYLDGSIETNNRESIITSLVLNKIAITDLISSCERKGYSALDSSLTKISWNHEGIEQLIDNNVTTFLCTSKWVMQNLQLHILKRLGYSQNKTESKQKQNEIFPFLKNSTSSLKPLAEVFSGKEQRITMLALPTPGGGTFRKLDAFGYTPTLNITTRQFVDFYIAAAFDYFKSCTNESPFSFAL